MLIVILIDVQYSHKAVFSFEKGSIGQNHSSSGSHCLLNQPPPTHPTSHPANPPPNFAKPCIWFKYCEDQTNKEIKKNNRNLQSFLGLVLYLKKQHIFSMYQLVKIPQTSCFATFLSSACQRSLFNSPIPLPCPALHKVLRN